MSIQITTVEEITPKAFMELVAKLQPFFMERKSSSGAQPVGFASYSAQVTAPGTGANTTFQWTWDGTAGQEDMFDLTNPALPAARQEGNYLFSLTAILALSSTPVANKVFTITLDLNGSVAGSGFASGSFPLDSAASASPAGNIFSPGQLLAGENVDTAITQSSGADKTFNGFAYFMRFPLLV